MSIRGRYFRMKRLSLASWRDYRVLRRTAFPAPTWHLIDVPVIDGIATLPDGRTVESSSQVVRVPSLGG